MNGPKPQHAGDDPYMQGWFAGDGAEPVALAANPYPTGSPEHERWALGYWHGLVEDADNAVNEREG